MPLSSSTERVGARDLHLRCADNLTAENRGGVSTSCFYEVENRLTGVLQPDGTRSTYTYQGDGLRRTAQEAGQAVKTFIWDGDDYLGEL